LSYVLGYEWYIPFANTSHEQEYLIGYLVDGTRIG